MLGKYWELISPDNAFPLQWIDEKTAVFILKEKLLAGSSIEFELVETSNPSPKVVLTEHGDRLSININGSLLTEYRFDDIPARPYFFPLYGPGQSALTRAYPMIQDVEGETSDHRHHRSIWIAHGEVNGIDNWSEDPGHGCTKHLAFDKITQGAVYGGFVSNSVWTNSSGADLLSQKLEFRAWAPATNSIKFMDFKIDLSADFGDVLFGGTKEGGILSVRVASELDVPKTGRITNGFGGVNEGETWGKPSNWCDYSGIIDGRKVGIAVLDHPLSFRHPTHWHVRNYGLMTANPFGYSHYSNGVNDGSCTLKKGGTLSFQYRMILHEGDSTTTNIASHYLNLAFPPKASLKL